MQPGYSFKLFSKDEPRIGVIIGTGPSLTEDQLEAARNFRTFGANRAFEFDVDVLHGCNHQFWNHYWPEIQDLRCHKWTTRPELKDVYPGLNYIEERWEPGLSRDPSYICAHHGTGPQLVNLAYHYGCEAMLLIGWDMRHQYKRHYFGEYPKPLQHFTRNLGTNGELIGLIEEMQTIHPDDYGIEIINCTPGSAMKCYPEADIKDFL